jgi:serine protease Do
MQDNIYEHIDRYLSGEMTEQERQDFELQMQKDPELSEEVQKQKELIELLDYHEETSSFKSKMNNIHKEIDVSKIKNNNTVYIKQKRGTLRFIANVATSTVAASIAILAILYFAGWFDYNRNVATYTEMRNDIDQISNQQRSMWQAIFNNTPKKSRISSATAFALSEDGYLVTSYHVVKNVDSIVVFNKLDSLITYPAELVFQNPHFDLALLKIKDTNFTSFPPIPYNFDYKTFDLGEYVYTLGYSKEDIVFGDGSISALTGYNNDSAAYQISIPVNPGNSGAPLIDENGSFVGIISGKNTTKESTAFAIKSDYLRIMVDSFQADTLHPQIKLPTVNNISWKKRTEQIKTIQPFVFKVEVFRNND